MNTLTQELRSKTAKPNANNTKPSNASDYIAHQKTAAPNESASYPSKRAFSILKSMGFLFAAYIFSFVTALCFDLVQGDGSLSHSVPSILIGALFLMPLILLASMILRRLVGSRAPLIWDTLPAPQWKRRSVLGFSAFVLACWAVWIVALFPGSMNWDTYYQIWQCYPESHPIYGIPWAEAQNFVPNYFSDHHPIFDTLIFGGFARVSDALFGTWNWGVFAFVLLQAFATSFSLVLSVAYLEKVNSPESVRRGLIIFFAITPIFPIYASTMLKDSLFSWLYVLYFLAVVHIALTKGAAIRSKRFLISLMACAILLALTKKTGLYVVLGTSLLLCAFFRKQLLAHLAPALACVATMWVIMPLVVFPLLDVAPGGKQEMLAVPFQQTAKYVSEHASEMEQWEYEAVDAILNMDTLAERYDPDLADPVKFMLNPNASMSDYVEYAKAYLVEGLRHPEDYLEAWLVMVAGYIAPTSTIGAYGSTGSPVEGESPLVWNPQLLNGLRTTMLDAYAIAASIPIANLPYLIVPYTLWIPLFCGIALARKSRAWLPVLAPVVMTLISCLITPATAARYALPLIYTAPILVGLTWGLIHRESSLQERQSER